MSGVNWPGIVFIGAIAVAWEIAAGATQSPNFPTFSTVAS